jgi:hypothetical protein
MGKHQLINDSAKMGTRQNHNTWEFGYYPYQMVVDD